jgi:hypothetical protein
MVNRRMFVLLFACEASFDCVGVIVYRTKQVGEPNHSPRTARPIHSVNFICLAAECELYCKRETMLLNTNLPPWQGGNSNGGKTKRKRQVVGEVPAATLATDMASSLAARLASVTDGS